MRQAGAARSLRADVDEAQHAYAVPATRRTVTVRGRPGYAWRTYDTPRHLRLVEVQRRRPPRRAQDRFAARPDRLALWALVMAVFLVLVTVMSAHGL